MGESSGFARRYVDHVKATRSIAFTFEMRPYEKMPAVPYFIRSSFEIEVVDANHDLARASGDLALGGGVTSTRRDAASGASSSVSGDDASGRARASGLRAVVGRAMRTGASASAPLDQEKGDTRHLHP